MISLVLGGTRSGKSDVAERLAAVHGAVTYVATGTVTDYDMARRIAAHRERRPGSWRTVEAGADLVSALAGLEGPALVDSLGAWVAATPEFCVDVDGLIGALTRRVAATIVVSEEVGLSVHPPTVQGRAFVDALGHVNRAVSAVADTALLVVAGRVLELPAPGPPP